MARSRMLSDLVPTLPTLHGPAAWAASASGQRTGRSQARVDGAGLHRIASKELHEAAGHRPWTLSVQKVGRTFDAAAGRSWEPGMKLLVTVNEQLLRLLAQDREYRLGDVCGRF